MSIIYEALYQAQYLITKNRKTIFWAIVSVFALSNFDVLSLGQIMEDNGLSKNNTSNTNNTNNTSNTNNKSGGYLKYQNGGEPGDSGEPVMDDKQAEKARKKEEKEKNKADKKQKKYEKANIKAESKLIKDQMKQVKQQDKAQKNIARDAKMDSFKKNMKDIKDIKKEKKESRQKERQESKEKNKALKDKHMSGSFFQRAQGYIMKGLSTIAIVLVLYGLILFPIIICAVFLYMVLKKCFMNLMKL